MDSKKFSTIDPSDVDPRLDFGTLHVHKGIKDAVDAASIITSRGIGNPSTLYIHGQTGLGKSHLLNAIGNLFSRIHRYRKVAYASAISLNDPGIDFRNTRSFKPGSYQYLHYDLLLVDDVNELAGHYSGQEALHTISRFLQHHYKKAVFVATDSPGDLKDFPYRLVSLFEEGLVVNINEPDHQAMLKIILSSEEARKLDLGPDIVKRICSECGSLLEAKAMADRMAAFSSHLQVQVETDSTGDGSASIAGFWCLFKSSLWNQTESEIWRHVSALIRTEIGSKSYNTWFYTAELAFIGNGRAVVTVGNRLAADTLTREFSRLITWCLAETLGGEFNLTVTSRLAELEVRKSRRESHHDQVDDVEDYDHTEAIEREREDTLEFQDYLTIRD